MEAVKKAQNAPKPPSTEKPEAESTLAKKMAELVEAVKMAVEGIEKSGCLDKVNWCAGIKPAKRAPVGGSWAKYVTRKRTKGGCEKTGPASSGHGHHIVMKGDRFPENAEARRILCKHGINPYTGCENLAITKNWCHSKSYAKFVLDQLRDVEPGGRAKIVEALKKLADRHNRCDVPQITGGSKTGGIVDEDTDELR